MGYFVAFVLGAALGCIGTIAISAVLGGTIERD